MNWDLPVFVCINGKNHPIRNNCDYRVVLDAICALNDFELPYDKRVECALFIFYENISEIDDFEKAINEMYRIINNGSEEITEADRPQLMDWEHDFTQIAPPISRVLGYDVRTPGKHTHWYSFLGGYMEIGDCTFSTVVSIRSKKSKGQKLEKWELEYVRENIKIVELPQKITEQEKDLLNSKW